MASPRTTLSRVGRFALRVLQALLALVLGACALLIVAYLALTHTAQGRALLLDLALEQANAQLRGTLQARELRALGLDGVALRGVTVSDPSGAEVLALETLDVELAPLALLDGELRVVRVAIADTRVDLADLGETRGVVAAFAPREPSPSEPESASEPPVVIVEAIEIDTTTVRAELPDFGVARVEALHARARFELRKTASAQLHALQAQLSRNDQPLGRIEATQANWSQADTDSTLALRAKLAHTSVSLDARARMPSDPAFATAPLDAKLVLDAVDADTLRALGQAELAEKLKASARVELRATGTPSELEAHVQVHSSAGDAELRASLHEQDRLELSLHSDGVTPGALWADLPTQRVATDLELHAQLADAPSELPFSLNVTRASLDGAPLPSLRAQGRLVDETVRDLRASAQGYGVTLDLTGDASAESLDVRGTLRTRDFKLPSASVGKLDVDFTASGQPDAPRVTLSLRGHALRYEANTLDEITLDAQGGPRLYDVKLAARAPEGKLRLKGRVKRLEDAVELDASASGVLRERPFSLRVERTVVGFAGALDVQRIDVAALGQQLRVSGRLRLDGVPSSRGLDVDAQLDLAALSQALQLEPALQGHAELRLRASGTLTRPIAELHLRGRELGVRDAERDPENSRPRADATLDAALDMKAGTLRTKLAVTSGADLSLHGEVSAAFDARRAAGPGAPAALLASRIEGSLVLDELTTQWLTPFLPEPLPLEGRLHAQTTFAGTLERPELALTTITQLRHPKHPTRYELTTELRYQDATAQLTLDARDDAGALLSSRAELQHPKQSWRELLDHASTLGHESTWSLSLTLEPRPLGAWPLDVWLDAPLDPELSAITPRAQVSVQHAPHAEPTVHASLWAEKPAHHAAPSPGQADQTEPACADQELALAVALALEAGKAHVQTNLVSEQQKLFDLDARARLALVPALQGQGAPALEDVTALVRLQDLELDALPRVCGLADGRVSGTIDARALLTESPELSVKLVGEKLGFGGAIGQDIELSARATSTEASVELALAHAKTRSTARARVPIRFAHQSFELLRDKPVSGEVKLNRLPVIALLPPSFAISRASGYLNGSVIVAGTLDAPDIGGHIEPERMALTVTGLAQPLHGIEGRIAFSNRRVQIERLVARDRGGSITLKGSAQLEESDDVHAQLSIKADGFPLRQQGQIAGEVDADIDVAARMTEARTQIDVRMKDASAWLLGGELRKGISLTEHPDIIDPRARERRAQLEREKESAAPTRPIEISINAEDSFWIRRDDFAVKLSTKLALKSDSDKVTVTGPLRIHRGYLQLFGQTFEIDGKSRVDFAGGSPPDPVLDITASSVNRASNQTVTVRIGGRASAPKLEFFVDDVQADAGQAAGAMFGGRGGAGDTNAQGEAKSFVAGMMAGVMAMSARRELGDAMPILMLEPAEDMRASRVRAGFELDKLVPAFLEPIIRGVYLEGIFAGGSDQNAASKSGVQGGVLLELYFPHDLVTAGQYGPGQTWSLDFGWEP